MDKDIPCYGCTERRVEHGYNCHMDCPRYKKFHDNRVAKLEVENKKRADEAIVSSVLANAAYKQKKKTQSVKYWKG